MSSSLQDQVTKDLIEAHAAVSTAAKDASASITKLESAIASDLAKTYSAKVVTFAALGGLILGVIFGLIAS